MGWKRQLADVAVETKALSSRLKAYDPALSELGRGLSNPFQLLDEADTFWIVVPFRVSSTVNHTALYQLKKKELKNRDKHQISKGLYHVFDVDSFSNARRQDDFLIPLFGLFYDVEVRGLVMRVKCIDPLVQKEGVIQHHLVDFVYFS